MEYRKVSSSPTLDCEPFEHGDYTISIFVFLECCIVPASDRCYVNICWWRCSFVQYLCFCLWSLVRVHLLSLFHTRNLGNLSTNKRPSMHITGIPEPLQDSFTLNDVFIFMCSSFSGASIIAFSISLIWIHCNSWRCSRTSCPPFLFKGIYCCSEVKLVEKFNYKDWNSNTSHNNCSIFQTFRP